MSNIGDLLRAKSGTVHTIGPDETVYAAIERMTAHNIGSLLVVRDGTVLGIVTERDYLRRVALEGRTSRETPVRDIMTPRVIYVTPEASIEETLALMTEQRVRHLPVMEDDRLVGLVSIGDCVKHGYKQTRVEVRYLKQYIADDYPGPEPRYVDTEEKK